MRELHTGMQSVRVCAQYEVKHEHESYVQCITYSSQGSKHQTAIAILQTYAQYVRVHVYDFVY